MRSIPRLDTDKILLVLLILALLPMVAVAQTVEKSGEKSEVISTEPDILAPSENSAEDDAEMQEEPAGFGYLVDTGELAVATDTAAVFCPAAGAIILHPHHANEALAQFSAKDNGDGTWEIPDPDTGEPVKAQTQFATAIFDDGRGGSNAAELRSLASLRVVSASNVALAPWLWPRCWRLRLHYRCGVVGVCPFNGQCFYGYLFSQRRNFLQCTYAPWNLCLEFLYPVCTVTRYTCRDCTGPIIWRRPLNRFVCAVF